MISNINKVFSPKVLNQVDCSKPQNVSFLSRMSSDIFEKEQDKKILTIRNPYTNKPCSLNYEDIDLTQNYFLYFDAKSKYDSLELLYNPQKTETLHDKNTNKDIDVVVLKSFNKSDPNETCFHFFSKDLKTNYGYGLLRTTNNRKNIKEISVKINDKNIDGLQELIDKHSIMYCKVQSNKRPTIEYKPEPNEYKKFYSAGKRFVLPKNGSSEYKFFMDKYNNPDPNKVIDEEKNTSHWPALKMYLPEEKVDEYLNNYVEGFSIYNPISYRNINIDKQIDITKPQKFESNKSVLWGEVETCTIEFDPNKKGQLVDKKTGKPIDVFIIKLHDECDVNIDSFHFYSKDLQHEYGHVEFDNNLDIYGDESYTKDYPKENIYGDRIIVNWLINEDDENIGGVGKLADKVAVKYCLDKGIKPNIISIAGPDSHIAHYSRGKRFIQPRKRSKEYNFLMKTYKTSDPNEALKMLLEESKKTEKKINLSKWNNGSFYMYLPQDLVEKYKNEDY